MADSRFYLKLAALLVVLTALFVGVCIAIQAVQREVTGPVVAPASTPAIRHGGPPPAGDR